MLTLRSAAPITDYFCRYGIRSGTDPNDAFLAPLGRHVSEICSTRELPFFSGLQSPVVFDLSPDDPGISEAFALAGYQIGATIDFDPHGHLLWKVYTAAAELTSC
jgi:hypothetical protein